MLCDSLVFASSVCFLGGRGRAHFRVRLSPSPNRAPKRRGGGLCHGGFFSPRFTPLKSSLQTGRNRPATQIGVACNASNAFVQCELEFKGGARSVGGGGGLASSERSGCTPVCIHTPRGSPFAQAHRPCGVRLSSHKQPGGGVARSDKRCPPRFGFVSRSSSIHSYINQPEFSCTFPRGTSLVCRRPRACASLFDLHLQAALAVVARARRTSKSAALDHTEACMHSSFSSSSLATTSWSPLSGIAGSR